jgi:hypothetical protein
MIDPLDPEYPIAVKFDDENMVRTFTMDGRHYISNKNPTLFWGEPTIQAPPPPKQKHVIEKYAAIYPRGPGFAMFDLLNDEFRVGSLRRSYDEADNHKADGHLAIAKVILELEA